MMASDRKTFDFMILSPQSNILHQECQLIRAKLRVTNVALILSTTGTLVLMLLLLT